MSVSACRPRWQQCPAPAQCTRAPERLPQTCGSRCRVPRAHTEPKKLPLVEWLVSRSNGAEWPKVMGSFCWSRALGYLIIQRSEGKGTQGAA